MNTNLLDQTRAALAGLPGPQSLYVEHGGQRLTCDLTAVDTLACAFTRLALATDVLADASVDRLRDLADTLSKRLTYLLEPISPIEVDPDHCVVQLRSTPPQKHEGRSTYYELLVRRGGELSLARYAKASGGERTVIPAEVTREVLLRLVGDFSAVVTP